MAGISTGGFYGSSIGGRQTNTPYQPPTQVQNTQSGMPVRKTIRRDGSGNSISQEEEYGPSLDDELSTKDKYNAQAEARRLASIRALMGSSGGGTGAGAGTPNIPFDEQGARNAAYARAKDTIGQRTRASVDALKGVLSESGRSGGAFEDASLANVVGQGGFDMGEFEREQLIQDLNRAGQIGDRESSASLTRRGQDLQSQQALFGLLNAAGRLY